MTPVILSRQQLDQLWEIDRSEIIDTLYRLDNGQLRAYQEYYDVRGWDPHDRQVYTPIHEACYDRGGIFFAFFDDETGETSPGPAIPETGVMTGAALLAQQCRADVYEPMVWQCAYRRAFLAENALQMAEGLLFEDELGDWYSLSVLLWVSVFRESESNTFKNGLAISITSSFIHQANVQHEPKKLSTVQHLMPFQLPKNTFVSQNASLA